MALPADWLSLRIPIKYEKHRLQNTARSLMLSHSYKTIAWPVNQTLESCDNLDAYRQLSAARAENG